MTGSPNSSARPPPARSRRWPPALRGSANAAATYQWLKKLAHHGRAGRPGRRVIALTHQALAARPDWRSTFYLRDLLTDRGLLLAADRQLLLYESWLNRRLATLASHPHHQLLRHSSASGKGSPECAPGR